MRPLFEIDAEILECVDQETGEIFDGDRLTELQMEREAKLEGVALWIKDLRAEAEAVKVEADKLTARKKSLDRKIDDIKAWLHDALEGQKLKTPRCTVSYTHSTKVQIDDEPAVIEWLMHHDGEDFLRYKAPEIRKDEMKAAMKDGKTFPGAHLVGTESVVIK